MYRGKGKLFLGLFAVTLLLCVAVSTGYSDDSSAEDISGTSLKVVSNNPTLAVVAGGTNSITLVIYHTYTGYPTLSIDATCDCEGVTVKTNYSPGTLPLSTERPETVILTAVADKYAHQGLYTISLTYTAYNPATNAYETGSSTLDMKVQSNLTSDKFNKFLGFIPNEFSGSLGSVWFTAAVSFLGLLAIGYVVMFIAVPVCSRILMKKDDPERKKLKQLLYRLCHVIVWLWVIGQVFRILGLDEELIDLINRLFYLAYVVVGVIVAWKLWKLIVDSLIKRIFLRADEFTKGDAAADFDSFRPLFLYLGEIILAIVATMLIMGLLGFNLTAIITSAGLVSLGISMGAQDVLKQFFSGLEILATRPFKKGDLVAVGADVQVYRVRRVNVMNTFLENWDNTDVFIMPNSLLTTNKIRNITRETLISKVYLTVDVAYGSDVNLARKLMQEAATENPHVISDGSVKRPYTRLEAFEDSNLLIKMGFYVDEYGSQWAISGQIRQGIISKFAAHGISIDYQQIVIHEAGKPETREGAAKDADDSE